MLKMRKMKDSGIEWIGEIPEGWEISKVSYFYEVQLGKMLQPQKKSETDTEEKYLCAANVGKNSLSLDTLKTMWFSQTEKHQFDLKEGDLLVVEGGDVASCAIIETPIRNLFFQNALHRVRPLHNESVAFLRYWLMTAKSYGYIDLICNKATIAHFSKEKFIALPILVIPQDIQSKIVSFLDLECKQIDDLLSKSRSSIEEYKKLKQAVITQAVTKGVRGEREMKDSGVEWIGEIPKEWVCEKIKYATSISRGLFNHRPRNDERYYNGKYPFIQTGDVANATKYIVSYSQTLNELGKSVSKDFPKGTLTMTIAANVGDVAILNFDAYFPDSVVGFVPNKNIRTLYLFYVFSAMKDEFIRTAIKSTQLNLNIDRVKETFIPVTLNVNEQCEIENYLESKCAEIDGLIAKKEQLVKELESYKKSLIYEVVTGKREV